ncbi:MAG: methylenetetrahydrofolate reductase [Chloroflexi bacterium]|nr:methylenetetrahydrofolate reductase [Chloroflexota bacterium]
MAKVTDLFARKGRRPLVAFDFSPPRSGDAGFAEAVRGISPDLWCVAYSPGRAVRLDSVATAAILKQRTGIEAIANMACRDMNRLALQMHLLGAEALGLQNVLVLRGDDFAGKDIGRVKPVYDYKPTELIRDITAMNGGTDFKGQKLASPTSLCAGASIDPNRDPEHEARLAVRKVEAGAQFIFSQAVYDPAVMVNFLERYRVASGRALALPFFWGLQVLVKDGVSFAEVPPSMIAELNAGRSGVDIAVDLAQRMLAAGCDALYIVAPILKGGALAASPSSSPVRSPAQASPANS